MAPNALTAADCTVPAMKTQEQIVDELRAQIAEAADKNPMAALPRKLSPSRASDFKKCPQKFYFETIAGIKSPQNSATLRGGVAHKALERIFDHPKGERTVELALSYVRPAWEGIINPDLSNLTERKQQYALAAQKQALEMITPGSQEESDMLEDASQCVRNWFALERVNNFTPTELELPSGKVIDGRELYVIAKLAGIDVHGFIDRLDAWYTPDQVKHWSITDYKTSPMPPWLKKPYPPKTVERIRHDAFFQLKTYAAVIWKMFGIEVERLRLVYIGTDDRELGVQEMLVDRQMVDETLAELENTWRDIRRAARTNVWPAKPSPLCDWCFFKDVCPAFSKTEDSARELETTS